MEIKLLGRKWTLQDNDSDGDLFGWVSQSESTINIDVRLCEKYKEDTFKILFHEFGHAIAYSMGSHIANTMVMLKNAWADAYESAVNMWDTIKGYHTTFMINYLEKQKIKQSITKETSGASNTVDTTSLSTNEKKSYN